MRAYYLIAAAEARAGPGFCTEADLVRHPAG